MEEVKVLPDETTEPVVKDFTDQENNIMKPSGKHVKLRHSIIINPTQEEYEFFKAIALKQGKTPGRALYELLQAEVKEATVGDIV